MRKLNYIFIGSLLLISAVAAPAQTPDGSAAASQASPAPTAVQSEAAKRYAATLKLVQQGNLAINFRKFRTDAALMVGHSASMLEGADNSKFKKLMADGKTEEALEAANRTLSRNYASVFGHVNAMTACLKLNRQADAELHRNLSAALLQSIERSGDGKGPQTAYFVATISEEYALLAYRLQLNMKVQSVTRQEGHAYDRLLVIDPKTGQTQTLWFNTDVDLGIYNPPAHTAEFNAKLQRAAQFYVSGQHLNDLPLVEELLREDPDDAGLLMMLADGLSYKANTNVSSEQALALLNRAREAAIRARQLGDNSEILNNLISRLTRPELAPTVFSADPAANHAMKDGEQALGSGDSDGALTCYTEALKIDPKLYLAALYLGDLYMKRDLVAAAGWYGKALAINPGNFTVRLHWGGGLMTAGHVAEARDQFVEAFIDSPGTHTWTALGNWARRANSKLSPPLIDRPQVRADSQVPDAASGGIWSAYTKVRAEWRQSRFTQRYPNATQYRRTLEEETEALRAVVAAPGSEDSSHPNPQLTALKEMDKDGVLEAWVLFNTADAGIAKDYAGYREGHREQLRKYIEKYLIRAN
jgi:tetratricopeptide (TPR) repeat protein